MCREITTRCCTCGKIINQYIISCGVLREPSGSRCPSFITVTTNEINQTCSECDWEEELNRDIAKTDQHKCWVISEIMKNHTAKQRRQSYLKSGLLESEIQEIPRNRRPPTIGGRATTSGGTGMSDYLFAIRAEAERQKSLVPVVDVSNRSTTGTGISMSSAKLEEKVGTFPQAFGGEGQAIGVDTRSRRVVLGEVCKGSKKHSRKRTWNSREDDSHPQS